MSVVMGCDPGQTGALALVTLDGQLLAVHDTPVVDKTVNARLLWQILAALDEDVVLAVVEDVHSMPKQGVSSSFKFGRSKGVLEGVVAALGCPIEMPSPSSWKRALRLSSDKEMSRAMAIELWPDRAAWFARKKDADRAEAALMAEWGRRLLATRSVA